MKAQKLGGRHILKSQSQFSYPSPKQVCYFFLNKNLTICWIRKDIKASRNSAFGEKLEALEKEKLDILKYPSAPVLCEACHLFEWKPRAGFIGVFCKVHVESAFSPLLCGICLADHWSFIWAPEITPPSSNAEHSKLTPTPIGLSVGDKPSSLFSPTMSKEEVLASRIMKGPWISK